MGRISRGFLIPGVMGLGAGNFGVSGGLLGARTATGAGAMTGGFGFTIGSGFGAFAGLGCFGLRGFLFVVVGFG